MKPAAHVDCDCPKCVSAQAIAYEALLCAMRTHLKAIVCNDATKYQHHQVRPSDGASPGPFGTIWKTPREIALEGLELIEPWLRHVVDCTDPDPPPAARAVSVLDLPVGRAMADVLTALDPYEPALRVQVLQCILEAAERAAPVAKETAP
jgi:hypothetical protein